MNPSSDYYWPLFRFFRTEMDDTDPTQFWWAHYQWPLFE